MLLLRYCLQNLFTLIVHTLVVVQALTAICVSQSSLAVRFTFPEERIVKSESLIYMLLCELVFANDQLLEICYWHSVNRIHTEYAKRCWLSETYKTIWKMARARQQTVEEWRG